MATEKQIQANRANAQLSTGPRTPVGIDIAKRNSLKTGLASLGLVRPEHWETDILEHADWLHSTLKADNPFELSLEISLSFHMVCNEEAERLVVARKLMIAFRAETNWEDDKFVEAEVVAEGLAKHPGSVARKLRSTKYGCLVMMERWRQLDDVLFRVGNWDVDQKSLAHDLLGLNPALRKAGTALDVPDDRLIKDHLHSVVRAEIEKLEARARDHEDQDELARDQARLGIDPLDEIMKLLLRYGRMHMNMILKIHGEFGRVDRKARNFIPSGVPKRRGTESRADFHDRMDEFRSHKRMADDRAREAATARRLAEQEAARLEAFQTPPTYRDGQPLEVYFRILQEWHDRKNGKPAPPPAPAEPDPNPLVAHAKLADALPEAVEEQASEPRPDLPADDAPPSDAPAAKPRKRRNR